MSPPSAIICLTGSELTRGETHDRNGPYLARELTELGFRIEEIRLSPDDLEALEASFRRAMEGADLVIISGGLGPTADDLTTEALARALGRGVHRDARAQAAMRERALKRLGNESRIPANYYKQAEVIDGARVLHNPLGLAPGCLVETGRGQAYTLPGVPAELIAMFRERVLPAVLERFRLTRPRIARAKILGVPESVAEARIQGLGIDFSRVEYGISARPGELTVRFLSRGESDDRYVSEVLTRLEREFEDALLVLPEGLGDEGDARLSKVVHDLLAASGLTLATAESCTGGLVATQLTDHPGSSAYFRGSVVAYENSVKERLLGVDAALLGDRGAVSEEVCRAMASGVKERFAVDYGVSTTGIAGPDGGSDAKPVGLVYIGLAGPSGAPRTVERRFHGDRRMVRAQAATLCLDLLRRELQARR
ncbi:MAG: CinA family nicotinamide mononucleotide deamidase-related protein [Planctomycetota bacterium]|nr:CinA family nicotinamide mononucleotide deamidase-related protein [Planctomycetota bacterium]